MTTLPKVGDVLWLNNSMLIYQAKVLYVDGDWLFVKDLETDRRLTCKAEDIACPEYVEARRKDQLKERIRSALFKNRSIAELEAALAALEGGDV
jgi:hypothetical protein